jgi:hypothetical protein
MAFQPADELHGALGEPLDGLLEHGQSTVSVVKLTSLTGLGETGFFILTSLTFKQNLLAVLDFMGNLSTREHEQPKTMDCAVERFPDETCPLPLHLAGGGSGLCTGD